MKYINCRWSQQDTLGDWYCVCGTAEYCSEVVNTDEYICNNCLDFYSQIESENIKVDDDSEIMNYE